MVYVLVLAAVFLVAFVVTEPLRRATIDDPEDERVHSPAPDVMDLEAARDAKYREIRDAELDHQTGKLSDADWRAIDSTLRAEAVEILRRLDRASGRRPGRG